EICTRLEFRRVLFRSAASAHASLHTTNRALPRSAPSHENGARTAPHRWCLPAKLEQGRGGPHKALQHSCKKLPSPPVFGEDRRRSEERRGGKGGGSRR